MPPKRVDGIATTPLSRENLPCSPLIRRTAGFRTQHAYTRVDFDRERRMLMFTLKCASAFGGVQSLGLLLMALSPLTGLAAQNYQIWVSNEKSGDVALIDGGTNQVIGSIPVGKRPRGIHAS